MGGERQDEVILAESRIRFHESNGEVHFHDDANNLKVAIKSPVWFQAWEDLKTESKKEIKLRDCAGNNTELTVKIKHDDAAGRPIRDVELTICEVQEPNVSRVGSVYAALEKFTNPPQ